MKDGTEYLRAGDVVALTGMSIRTVRRWIADETIPWRCQSKILNTWSGHRTAQINPEKCRKINDREIRF